ncbi:UDP-phosphate galactose phosphotransferase [Eubacterium sp. An11]|uniref:sugar transferase n=1 Tax=Eubacterium sp. An11 TaxID=1965542 RepID=UPI000B381061|nr:sugar transferase [Eubacterium sp. An11]OUQ67902.1 UDP-phosphate galactose phosphotransferase [Eubacterium sp. An11]
MYKKIIKRIMDITISIVALPFFLLVSIPIAIAIKLDDGGSVFYISERYGIHMKKFGMIKFRTMKMNAPDIRNKDGSTFNSATDRRLTKIGGVLRKTSLDELPQLINVLIGDMSLIGPRPSPMGNEATYTKYIKKKFEVKPGVTGYNQALLRNTATLEERYSNDVYYSEHVTFLFDIKIFFMTIKSVLRRQNIYNS